MEWNATKPRSSHFHYPHTVFPVRTIYITVLPMLVRRTVKCRRHNSLISRINRQYEYLALPHLFSKNERSAILWFYNMRSTLIPSTTPYILNCNLSLFTTILLHILYSASLVSADFNWLFLLYLSTLFKSLPFTRIIASNTQKEVQTSICDRYCYPNCNPPFRTIPEQISSHIPDMYSAALNSAKNPHYVIVACEKLDSLPRPEFFDVSIAVCLSILKIMLSSQYVQQLLDILWDLEFDSKLFFSDLFSTDL